MDPLMLASTIGNISALALFLSPLPTIWRLNGKKTTEGFHQYNYLAGFICYLWIVFGIPNDIHPNTLIWPINCIGLVLYFYYWCVFAVLTSKDGRLRIFAEYLAVFSSLFVTFAGAIFVCAFYIPSQPERENMVAKVRNAICIFFSISFYASPLTVVLNVFKAKSVRFLPFWVALAGFTNACVWTVYALMLPSVDISLLVVHGCGALLSAFQLVLHVIYGDPIACFLESFKMVSQKNKMESLKWVIYDGE